MAYKIKHESKTTAPSEAQLLSGMDHFMDALEQHRRNLIIGAFVVLVAGAAVGGALWYDAQQETAAAELERQAMQHYLSRPADKPAVADRNLKESIALYRRLIEQYPRSRSAQLAHFHLGNALVQMNDVGGAIEAYNKYIAAYGTNKVLLGLVYQRLAYAHLISGDRDAAAKAFTSVMTLPDTMNKDQVLFELGKLEESVSRPEGALAHYQDLIKIFPNSPFASEATIRMKSIEAKQASPTGPAVSEPSKTPSTPQPAKK